MGLRPRLLYVAEKARERKVGHFFFFFVNKTFVFEKAAQNKKKKNEQTLFLQNAHKTTKIEKRKVIVFSRFFCPPRCYCVHMLTRVAYLFTKLGKKKKKNGKGFAFVVVVVFCE